MEEDLRGKPEKFGCLRRPECDTSDAECWEGPDGKLFYSPTGKAPVFHKFTGTTEIRLPTDQTARKIKWI